MKDNNRRGQSFFQTQTQTATPGCDFVLRTGNREPKIIAESALFAVQTVRTVTLFPKQTFQATHRLLGSFPPEKIWSTEGSIAQNPP